MIKLVASDASNDVQLALRRSAAALAEPLLSLELFPVGDV
jgi:hypothetical protein